MCIIDSINRYKIAEKCARLDKAQREVRQKLRKARKEERERMISSIVSICQELETSKKFAAEKVAEKCHLDFKEAEKKVEQYWEKWYQRIIMPVPVFYFKTGAGIVFGKGEKLSGYENLHNMLTKYLN